MFDPANTKNQNHGIVKLQKWFTNFEILRMVTCDNARLLALSGARNPYPGNLGVIEEGALADLLVIEGNPLERIEVLENPHDNLRVIVKDGVVCKTRSDSKSARRTALGGTHSQRDPAPPAKDFTQKYDTNRISMFVSEIPARYG